MNENLNVTLKDYSNLYESHDITHLSSSEQIFRRDESKIQAKFEYLSINKIKFNSQKSDHIKIANTSPKICFSGCAKFRKTN